ncbi:hypothetical protein [Aeromonas sp. 61P]|uniref:hypothetical protein n=1 Tax=Aeromonas sp. 61P TaxID=3452721 RepID=UPI003F7B2E4C
MTAAITNFDGFLDNVDDYYAEVYSLYHAVANETEMGSFKCVPANRAGAWLVRTAGSEDLLLASPAAKQAFLRAIVDRFIGDEEDGMDIEGWYAYNRAMENDND